MINLDRGDNRDTATPGFRVHWLPAEARLDAGELRVRLQVIA